VVGSVVGVVGVRIGTELVVHVFHYLRVEGHVVVLKRGLKVGLEGTMVGVWRTVGMGVHLCDGCVMGGLVEILWVVCQWCWYFM